MRATFILGDVCHDLVVCGSCERMLELEAYYISTVNGDGVEGPAWCVECVEAVVERVKKAMEFDSLMRQMDQLDDPR